jgi:tetratricopeptide (TPR) repeat protein
MTATHLTAADLATQIRAHSLALELDGRHTDARDLARQADRLPGGGDGDATTDATTAQVRILTASASCLGARGRLAEADSTIREALRLAEASFGRSDPETAEVHRAFGRVLRKRGRYAEAATNLWRALSIVENETGSDHPDTAGLHRELAELGLARGRLIEAESHARQGLEIRGTPDRTDPEAATDATVLAAILIAAGRNDEAEPLIRQAKGTLSGI